MTTESTTSDALRPATDADGKLLLEPGEARELLRECFAQFQSGMLEFASVSIDGTNDLFEDNQFVKDTDVVDFRSKRPEWTKQLGKALEELFEKRVAGARRQGRRPDADRSLASLRVLNAFDQEKQAALVTARQFLLRLTKREVDALDLRVGVLLGEALTRDIDNPFAPDYILDAIGMTSRALYPNARVWRPLMERVLSEVTPAATKVYIRMNRLLADRHVLPEIKAELRARSELRPHDDSELLPLFSRLIKEVAPPDLALNVAVPAASATTPETLAGTAAAPTVTPPSAPIAAQSAKPGSAAAPAATAPASAPAPPAPAAPIVPVANPYAADMAQAAPTMAAPSVNAFGLPQVDPLLALGSLSAVVAALDRWQLSDPSAHAGSSQADLGAALLPLNRIPWIRAAVEDKVTNPTDKITIDVIKLLFDYIFRDPSIPESLRSLFGKLQVPILKAALLDRTFFSDKKHPARRLLDHLAAAAVGATSDEAYRTGFELVATGVIDEVCRDFKVDVAVFDAADAKLQEFVEAEQRKTASALDHDVAEALAVEAAEADRAEVRALVRDKLTGITVPFEVRAFAETVWADYLTQLRERHGAQSEAWKSGVQTLDDLLWSITAKERNAQKARLAKMVPGLVRGLRTGGAVVQVRDDRMKPFLETVYHLHMAAIKPQAATAAKPTISPSVSSPTKIANVHDFVGEMVVGTWLAFDRDGETVNARLSWVSPMRTKYIFTSRSRSRALAVTPEELAWQLGAGSARLVLEPVPLFDRAVSAALDELAAQKPASGSVAAAA
ncbi:MAG TPA: DUF1631 family protein [Casimicrobiaceae bacterium]|nr:DUF1631 family protein [Casimicrobiaceae bacterium]